MVLEISKATTICDMIEIGKRRNKNKGLEVNQFAEISSLTQPIYFLSFLPLNFFVYEEDKKCK